jgi:hypothetical protein
MVVLVRNNTEKNVTVVLYPRENDVCVVLPVKESDIKKSELARSLYEHCEKVAHEYDVEPLTIRGYKAFAVSGANPEQLRREIVSSAPPELGNDNEADVFLRATLFRKLKKN